MNKYKKWYDNIIAIGKHQREPGYERHHILPKSLGGTDEKFNLIFITAREHFICHWLLTKIYPTGEEHWKMLNALRMMRAENKNQQRYQTKITSRVYAKLKEEYSELQSERFSGANNPFYGKTHTDEVIQRIREANTGEKNGAKQIDARRKITDSKLGKKRAEFSEEWKTNMAKAKVGENNNMYGKTHKTSTIELMRQKAIGRKQSPNTIAKKADAVRGSKREKKQCPHCNQLVAVNGYARWHGTNCKHKE